MVTSAKETRGGQAVVILALVNAGIMLLRFSEQCILARALGAGEKFDAYFIGQIVILLGGQLAVAVTSAGVPALVEAGDDAPSATRRFFVTIAVALAVISALTVLFSGSFVNAFGGKLDDQSRLLTRHILLWLLPATDLYILAAVLRAYWHAERRFLLPGIGQLFMPFCTCMGAVMLAAGFWSLTSAVAVANVGIAALVLLLAVPLWPSSPKSTIRSVGNVPALTRRFWTSLLPVSIGLAVMPGMVAVARIYSSHLLSGSVTAISLASSVGSIPAQFAAASVGVVLLSQTAVLKAAGRNREGARIIERALCNTAFVVIPSAIILALFSRLIVEVVFLRGAFDKTAVGITTSALSVYSFGVPFQAAVQVLTFALFAFAGSRQVAITAAATLGANILLSSLLLGWGVPGLASAFSLSSFLDCAVLIYLLSKALPELEVWPMLIRHFRILVFSLISGAAANLAVSNLLLNRSGLRLAIALLVAGSVYVGAGLLFSLTELQEIVGTVRSRVSRYRQAEALGVAE